MRPSRTLRIALLRTAFATRIVRSQCPRPQTILDSPSTPLTPIFAPYAQSRLSPLAAFLPPSPGPGKLPNLPGLGELQTLVQHLDKQIGPPPDREMLIIAFGRYVQNVRQVENRDVGALRRAYEYLQSLRDPPELPLPLPVLRKALTKLRGGSPEHLALARIIFSDLTHSGHHNGYSRADYIAFIPVLCYAGALDEATNLCRTLFGRDNFSAPVNLLKRPYDKGYVWRFVIKAYAKRGNEEMVLRLFEEASHNCSDVPPARQALIDAVVEFYAGRDAMGEVQKWYEKALSEGHVPAPATHVQIARMCMRGNSFEWGNTLLKRLSENIRSQPVAKNSLNSEALALRKKAWDTALRFSASLGSTAEELSLLLQEMEEQAQEETLLRPDSDTIDGIMDGAMIQKNARLIGACREFLQKEALTPGLVSLENLVQHHLNSGDTRSALETFEQMRHLHKAPHDYGGKECQRLLQVLAEAEEPDLHQLSSIYREMAEWGIELNPDTLCVLVATFLNVGAIHDAKLLLWRHAGLLPGSGTQFVISFLVEYAVQPDIPIEIAYEVYLTLTRTFPALSIWDRQKIMDNFFRRNQPMMGIKVLRDMSHHIDRGPTAVQYATAFAGIARTRSLNGLEQAHRQMILDPKLTPDTILRNSLMQAYARCGMSHKALLIYDEIARSAEGPDSVTISLVFDVWGRRRNPTDLQRARNFYNRCVEHKVPLTYNNLASYIEALARNMQWKEAWEVVKKCQERHRMPPDEKMISTLFNTYKRSELAELEDRLDRNYPEVWGRVRAEMHKVALEAARPGQKEEEELEEMFGEEMARTIREEFEKENSEPMAGDGGPTFLGFRIGKPRSDP